MTCATAALLVCLSAAAPGPDRSTPYATVTGFLAASQAGDDATAAVYLWPGETAEGPALVTRARNARRLRIVLTRALWVDTATLSREPEGEPGAGRFNLMGEIPLPKGKVPLRLARVTLGSGARAWVFSEETVAAIDTLFSEYGPPFSESLPEWLYQPSALGLELWQWFGLGLALVAATLSSRLLQRAALSLGARWVSRTRATWDDHLLSTLRGPLALLMWALVANGVVRLLLLSGRPERFVAIVIGSVTIASVVWFLLRLLDLMVTLVALKQDGPEGRLSAWRTQFELTRQVLQVVIWVVGAAVFLLQFQVVRNVGVSLLASAGIVSVVLGFAAQKSLGSLFAGIQLSITEPVQLGDQVVVAGHAGVVDELHLTYLVVRTWDMRRVVVPITDFLDKPFENWSRGSAELIANVTLKVDFRTEVAALRAEVDALVAAEPGATLWNRRVKVVQVIDNDERCMTVRVALSADTNDRRGELANLVREHLIHFLATQHPGWLPVARSLEV